jgi:hypothetical protein
VVASLLSSTWKNVVPSTAIPNAPPSCCTEVSTPEADPDSRSSTPASTMSKNGAIERPMPSPITARDGDIAQIPMPSPAHWSVSTKPANPTAVSPSPTCIRVRPSRSLSGWATTKPTTMPAACAIPAMPALNGL